VPPDKANAHNGAIGEGGAVDAASDLYTAEAIVRGVTKHSRTRMRPGSVDGLRPRAIVVDIVSLVAARS
jgi:hypothetical protein